MLEPQLTPLEHTRRALHRAVDRICVTWPQALDDADARGYPQGVDYNVRRCGSDNTSVEAAALTESHAVAWLAELAEVLGPLCGARTWTYQNAVMPMHAAVQAMCLNWPDGAEHVARQLIRLANTGLNWWPPVLKTGQTVAGVTVGRRTSTVEICVFCQNPVLGGHDDPIRRVGLNSDPVHRSPCWYALTMSRGQHPRQKTG